MDQMNVQDALDAYFADQLGCKMQDLWRGEVVVVSSPSGPTSFQGYGRARGREFRRPLWGVQTVEGVVISVRQEWREEVDRVVGGVKNWTEALTVERWLPFREQMPSLRFIAGFLLYCDRQGFTPYCHHEPVLLPNEHPLRQAYGPDVPAVCAIILGDRVVSHAHIKPLVSDAVWEIAVGTDPDQRGKGYAKAVVSAATQFILAAGGVALYVCDEDNAPSLAVARRLGYTEYGRDLLCFETYSEHEGSDQH
jgi:GNAT superfamily N-acetyltransferase